MHAFQLLKYFGPVPVTHQNLVTRLPHYKRPNDKIRDWVDKGYLLHLAKGMYAISEAITGARPSSMLVGNMLYGPSYISLEYALSYYQAIPEAVVEVSSVTTRRSKSIENPLGRFSYTHVPMPYYSYGIEVEQLAEDQYGLIATPEKALFDTVVTTRNLLLRSRKDARLWLEDMRLDEAWLEGLDHERMHQLLEHAPKKASLVHLVNSLPAYVA